MSVTAHRLTLCAFMYGQFRCRTRFAKLTITASNIRKPKHDYSKNEKSGRSRLFFDNHALKRKCRVRSTSAALNPLRPFCRRDFSRRKYPERTHCDRGPRSRCRAHCAGATAPPCLGSLNFPQEARGLSPGRNAGFRNFLILEQTQPNHAHSFRLRHIQPL